MAKKSHTDSASIPDRLTAALVPISLFCLLWCFIPNSLQATSRSIEIQYADANKIAEALDGLIELGGSLSVYQNTLIIQASPANIEELQNSIEVLDEAPRALLISIKSPTQSEVVQAARAAQG
jgi:type II secretory pathway component GspD/PulD (secretin)